MYLTFAYMVGEGGAAVGVVAGVLIVVSGLVGLGIYFAYSRQLREDNAPDRNETSR